MAKKFREYSPDQQLLLPPDLSDWVPDDHVARFIGDVVDRLDMAPFYKMYDGALGQPPYHPNMMLKVILYSFSRGVFSSRKMEKATYEDVATRFLSADQHPDFVTFCKFRRRHGESIHAVFVQGIMMCRLAGLCTLGHVAIDGTILKGNASRAKTVKSDEIDKVISKDEKLIQELLSKWEAKDSEKNPKSQLPEGVKKRRNRQNALNRAKKIAEDIAQQRHERELARFEAEEAIRQEKYEEAKAEAIRVFNNKGPTLKNARLAVGLTRAELASKSRIARERFSNIEGGHRFPSSEEKRAICKALNQDSLCFPKVGPLPRSPRSRAVPDRKLPAHVNPTDPESACITRVGKESVQGYNAQVAVDSDHQIVVGLFLSNETTDRNNFIPMMKQILERFDEKPKEASADSGYYRAALHSEPCLQGIEMLVPPERKLKKKLTKPCPHAQSMREKLSSEKGKARYSLRSKTVEPVFGDWKHCKGFRHFLTRGIKNVTTELALMAIAHNILKMMKYGGKPH